MRERRRGRADVKNRVYERRKKRRRRRERGEEEKGRE